MVSPLKLSLAVLLLVGSTTACSKQELLQPEKNLSSSSGRVETGTGTVIINPSVSSLTEEGDPAFNSAYTASSYAGYIKSIHGNGVGSKITINGLNFGTVQGTVSIEKLDGTSWVAPLRYTTAVVANSWKDKSIQIYLASGLTAEPMASARLKITTSDGRICYRNLRVVPYILNRQYMQCTWHCIKRTLESGLASWTPAYSTLTNITASYTPTAHDVLSWGINIHQAYIENVVTTPETGGVTRYDLTISESNAPTRNNGNTVLPVRVSTTIKIRTVNGVRSFVAGFGLYRSTRPDGATQVRIQ